MADKLDLLISDYMTGMLQVKINSRAMWITRQKNEERRTKNELGVVEQVLIQHPKKEIFLF